MHWQGRWIAAIILGWLIVSPTQARADDGPVRPSAQTPLASPQGPLASSQQPRLPIPAGLPRYELDARLDVDGRKVMARERVQFTNRPKEPTRELVFHVYPRFQVRNEDRAILSKTME